MIYHTSFLKGKKKNSWRIKYDWCGVLFLILKKKILLFNVCLKRKLTFKCTGGVQSAPLIEKIVGYSKITTLLPLKLHLTSSQNPFILQHCLMLNFEIILLCCISSICKSQLEYGIYRPCICVIYSIFFLN